jgi:rhodanese-related sulfurtransferase
VGNIARIGLASARAQAASGEAVLIDVRPEGDYAAQHIAGAISMPSDQVARRYRQLPRDKLLIFYCT